MGIEGDDGNEGSGPPEVEGDRESVGLAFHVEGNAGWPEDEVLGNDGSAENEGNEGSFGGVGTALAGVGFVRATEAGATGAKPEG